MPTVSIGMPVYNGEKYISEAIESILSQTYLDFELIISDNHSEDSTFNICKKYLERDPRIKIYQNKFNVGATINYNQLVNYAKGKYFKWAACDDILANTYLESCVEILENDISVSICFPKTKFIDANGKEQRKIDDYLHLQSPLPHKRLKTLLLKYRLCMPVLGLMKRSILKKTNLIGPYIGSDLILMIELCLLGKFYQVPEFLFYRRDHNLNVRRMTLIERAKWFDPNYQGIMHRFPVLFLTYQLIRIIKNIKIPLKQKIKCYPIIGLWIFRKIRNTAGKYRKVTWEWILNKVKNFSGNS